MLAWQELGEASGLDICLSVRLFFILKQNPWSMRTTLELPVPLFARLKARAASGRAG